MKRVCDYKYGLILAILMMIFSGCGPRHYYMLSSAPTYLNYSASLPTIGVEKVLIPEYMQNGKVAIQRSDNEIVYLEDSNWAGDLSALLTQETISVLQKSFKHPDVYAYPWDFSKQPEIKIKIMINRFIAKGGFVYIDANYTIKNLRSKKSYSRLFRERIPAAADPASIVAGMSGAYGKLTNSLIQDLNQRF